MVGKVVPPSVEREILTFAALTGAAVVPATFQVTVKLLFPGMEIAVLGAVTVKGPGVPLTITFDDVVLMPPPLARLSRAITWNTMVRLMAGSSSPVRYPPVVAGGTLALFSIYCRDGNVLVPLAVGK